MSGKLIVIEGIDGSGKSTQALLLRQRLEKEGRNFRYQKFPRYENPSSQLLRMYLGGEFGSSPDSVNPYASSAFFSVDRVAAFLQGLGDFYKSGGLILCDRFTTSNAVHQAAKLPEHEQIPFAEWLFDFEYNKLGLPWPDMVIFLDVTPESSASLIRKRGDDEDIHETDLGYLRRASEVARKLASHYNWTTIKCDRDGIMRSPEDIAGEIYQKVLVFLD
ncbi:MAG: deoxynucleoside kinase [Clostridiales bacterium]|nr:deoxynucleoside kinase [Clostridiales bacterium]